MGLVFTIAPKSQLLAWNSVGQLVELGSPAESLYCVLEQDILVPWPWDMNINKKCPEY